MMGIPKSRESIGQARRDWEQAEKRGELKWLENPTFISSSCFAPPARTSQVPRAWERVAVPRASASRCSDHKIYKRITATFNVDEKYQATVAELESQGFGERKRARAGIYLSPYGDAQFEERKQDETNGQEMLDKAREQVRYALEAMRKDSLGLCNSPSLRRKRSTYDPAQLTWVPRKRHNTRWPVNPPDETCDFIAELQPLIKFELHPSQIDETQDLQQQNEEQRSPQRLAAPEKRAHQGQRHNRGPRRRTLRPSLSTISEADDEPSAYPVLTPCGDARPLYTSPMKGMNGADRFRTPTKVAESPMKVFTITATHVEGGKSIEITNSNDHFQVPSPTNPDNTTGSRPISPDHPNSNHEGNFYALSDIYTKTTTAAPAASSAADSSNSTFLSALPFFEGPAPAARGHDEPGHEAKRRISLDNARRSDRRSDAKIMKRVNHWMERTAAGNAKKRRYSEVPDGLLLSHEKTPQNRRHTLDVDVGRNLDIFGQQAEAAPAVDSLQIPTAPYSFKPALNKPASITPSMGELPPLQPISVNPLSRLQNLNFPATLLPTALINDGGNTVMSEAKETGLESAANEELEVEIHIPEDVDDITAPGVADQDVTNANDRTACTVIEETEIDGTAAEQDNSRKSDAPQNEIAAALDGDVFSENENVDGDSALADLHSFVRRAKSSKERKDVPASAMILPPLATSSLTKKHPSGSLGSATSENGSPVSKIEKMATTTTTTMTSPRVPLGQKDANKSPSPSKKRKLKGSGPPDAAAPLTKKSGGRLVAPDLEDYGTEAPAQPKKRRRKIEADRTGDIFNPDMFPSQDLTKRTSSSSSSAPDRDGGSASRRSSRIATVKKTAAIPVRLPGSATLDLGDMPAPSTATVTARKADRDLAAQTRANTDKNKGGAMPVAFVLASLGAAVADEDDQQTASITLPKTGMKSVRWDEILARVQGEEMPAPAAAENGEGAADEEEEMALPPPPQLRFASDPSDRPGNPVGGMLANEDEEEQGKKDAPAALSPAPVRRSARSAASRLPTRGGSATPVKKKSSLPSAGPGSVSKPSAASATEARARLGMAGPGTPGPRRGGRRR